MKGQIEDVKRSIYTGMSIYNGLKNREIDLGGENISLEDKKYLSLYLGIIHTDNKISRIIRYLGYKYNIFGNYRNLSMEEYVAIYNNHFIGIVDQINFQSMEDYFKYLLDKDIIKKFNQINNCEIDKMFNVKNKTLVKQIK